MAYDAEAQSTLLQLDILTRARDRIAQGWTPIAHALGNNVCLIGAIQVAHGIEPYSNNEGNPYRDYNHIVRLLGFKNGDDAATWNDSQEDSTPVLARFDAAIQRALNER